jgi:tRNA (uracil-5-)-methyltransferase TRM9
MYDIAPYGAFFLLKNMKFCNSIRYMHREIAQGFARLNQDFYETIGKYWNNDPHYEWEGWNKLLLIIQQIETKKLKVLDLGCGNGRFATYLQEKLGNQKEIEYVGIDFSDFLLSVGVDSLGAKPSVFKLISADVLFENWVSILEKEGFQAFDLVVLFGVMHHIPGDNFRTELIQKAASVLTKNGVLVFTSWQFLEDPRLSKRVLDKQSDEVQHVLSKYQLQPSDLEEGDYILSWVKKALGYRYSHFYTKSEIDLIIQKADLQLVTNFLADGRFSKANGYFVCKKS